MPVGGGQRAEPCDLVVRIACIGTPLVAAPRVCLSRVLMQDAPEAAAAPEEAPAAASEEAVADEPAPEPEAEPEPEPPAAPEAPAPPGYEWGPTF